MSTAIKQSVTYDDYVAGRLSPAKHALLSEYLSLNPVAANDAAFEDNVAAELLCDMEGAALDDSFFDKVTAALDDLLAVQEDSALPNKLSDRLDSVTWRTRLPGISTCDIIGDRKQAGDRLYLLKMRAGMGVWDHGHTGDEWVLVLKGSYTSGGENFTSGDIHMENADSVHSLKAGDNEDCVCLVMTQGPVKMNSVLGRVLSPIVGL